MGCDCIGPDFLVIVLVISETVLVLEGTRMTDPIFGHERLDVYRLAIDVDSLDLTD